MTTTRQGKRVKEIERITKMLVALYLVGIVMIVMGYFMAPVWARSIMTGLYFMYIFPKIAYWMEKKQRDHHVKEEV